MNVLPQAVKARFSLLEVVLTLIVSGIVGSALISYAGTMVTSAGRPLADLERTLALESAAESITADYRNNFFTDLPGLRVSVGPEGTHQSNAYGEYDVIHCRFIQFDESGQEQAAGPGNQEILKVTLENGAGERLALLLTDRS